MGEFGKRVVDKILSGRFLATLLFIITFCVITILAMAYKVFLSWD